MNNDKAFILKNIGYSSGACDRINKKLGRQDTQQQIQQWMSSIVRATDDQYFETIGKNFYISHIESNIRITLNASTCRVITVDRIRKQAKTQPTAIVMMA